MAGGIGCHIVEYPPLGRSARSEIEEATLLHGGGKVNVMETTRNEYNVNVPDKVFREPFVIRLQIRVSKENKDKYMDALT